MVLFSEIIDHIHSWAPPETAAAWDNVGLQIGKKSNKIKSILLSLDLDLTTLNHLKKNHYDLIITHHPLFFKTIKHLDFDTDLGRCVSHLITNKQNLFSAHTNLDVAKNGVNDCLVKLYGLNPLKGKAFEDGFGKIITLAKETSINEFKKIIPAKLVGSKTKTTIKKVAFLAGSGSSFTSQLKESNVDLFITGELGYHHEISLEFDNIAALVLGHKESEVCVLPEVKKYLVKKFRSLTIDII